MHNHEEDKKGSWTMWAMAFCCILPFVVILIFFGAGGKAFGTSTWVIFGGIAVMVAAHLFMMFIMGKSHKHPDEEHERMNEEDKNKDVKDNKTHPGHGCCH